MNTIIFIDIENDGCTFADAEEEEQEGSGGLSLGMVCLVGLGAFLLGVGLALGLGLGDGPTSLFRELSLILTFLFTIAAQAWGITVERDALDYYQMCAVMADPI